MLNKNESIPENQQSVRTESGETEIDLLEFAGVLWKYKFVIAVCAVICALFMFVKVSYLTADTYTASGVLYVSNRSDSAREDSDGVIQKNDIETAKTLTPTYIELLETRDFLENVSSYLDENTDSECSWKDIKKKITISAINSTELLKISVIAESAQLANDIASAMIDLAPSKLIGIYEGGKAEVADNVYMPERADDKGVVKFTVIGFLIGIILGAGYAFLRYIFDKKVRSSAEITKRYGFSILGELADPVPNRKKNKADKNLINETQSILNKDSSFDTVETYKAIRTNIMFSITKSEKGKVVAITSSCPGEGKTTTSVNLAMTFAQTGAKVMLIDCDLRKARIHRYLRIDRGEGVSNVLCGFCELERVIRHNVRENLDVLTAGEIPPNPAELLDSDEFSNMISALREKYDYIFIDTPPVTVVTDGMLVMNNSHGVIVVVRENETTFDVLDEAVENIEKADCRVFGAVVLDAVEKQKKYGYYKSGKYGHKYGYKNGYKYGYKYATGYGYKDPDEKDGQNEVSEK